MCVEFDGCPQIHCPPRLPKRRQNMSTLFFVNCVLSHVTTRSQAIHRSFAPASHLAGQFGAELFSRADVPRAHFFYPRNRVVVGQRSGYNKIQQCVGRKRIQLRQIGSDSAAQTMRQFSVTDQHFFLHGEGTSRIAPRSTYKKCQPSRTTSLHNERA